MVETVTKNYQWTKPEVTKSAATWGGFLNTDLDSIDALVFANQQGLVPVGTVTMFAGATAPANWLLCKGQALPAASYPALYNVIGGTYGWDGTNFALPNLQQRFPLGAGPNPLGQQGGGFSYTISASNMPVHNHAASQDPHVHAAWQSAHSHSIYQDAHSHNVYQDSHSHGDYGHGHGASASQDNHTHTIPASAGGGFGAAEPPQPMVAGQGSTTTSGASASNVYVSIATGYANLAAQQPAVHIDAQQPAVHCDTQTPAVAVDTRQPNVYTANAGGGAAMSIVPQFIAINFIIRYQ